MNRFVFVLLVFVCGGVFGQDGFVDIVDFVPGFDLFDVVSFSGDDSIKGVVVDTVLWSAAFSTFADYDLEVVVTDTGVVDSVAIEFQLWQGLFADTASMHYVKKLTWTKSDRSVINADSIGSVGRWACDVGRTFYYEFPLSAVKVLGLATCKLKLGVDCVMRACAIKGEEVR